MNEHIQKSIDGLKDIQKKVEEPTYDEKKTPEENAEEEYKHAGSVLFNQITESTIKILQTDEIEKSLTTIANNMKMDCESISALINVIAISMTNSAHQAILFYDDLLKRELTKQMDNVGHHINLGKADMEAFKSVLEIYRKRIDEISNIIKMNDIKKEN